jgi:hypothetical protein
MDPQADTIRGKQWFRLFFKTFLKNTQVVAKPSNLSLKQEVKKIM